jgi:LytS/YehU family sensor histidine kinase
MVELQLENLRAQLNPHFMFNSLNAIQELIVTDKTELSQSYLERFAKLLRMLLENASQPFIPLRKEINFLELYLSLENLRIPDLKYSIKIAPAVNTESDITPNMMLQPYIENALWHGLQHKQGEKRLELYISRENGSMNYEIKDNGVGRKKAEELKSLYRKEHRSKGMELLSKRFSLLSKEYGQDIQTSVTDLTENGDGTGTVVKIKVPFSLSKTTQRLQ